MQRRIKVLEDQTALAREAAVEFTDLALKAVAERGVFAVALSGGSTPKVMYSLLADDVEFSSRLSWDRMHFFWGDERYVPSDNPESNFRMVHEALLSKVPVPVENVHRVKTELGAAADVAEDYQRVLEAYFGKKENGIPRFDLVLLGMGPDGHTASLFPGTTALAETERLVVANWVEKFQTYRITITLPVINNAAHVMFIVGGPDKAEMLRKVIGNQSESTAFPSQLVQPHDGELIWLVDRDAAKLLIDSQ
ncbi:MAG: 6-phosphogluconolactonase [Blastocatellia bacterium]|nr:6-phosphogluconolactonase [Blastocatellia bacterium]